MEHYTDVLCPVIIVITMLPAVPAACGVNLSTVSPFTCWGVRSKTYLPHPSWMPEPGAVLSPIYTMFFLSMHAYDKV